MQRITELMEEKQLYKVPDLKVLDIASELRTNARYVSDCIKNSTNYSFTQYVNSYRIQHAQQLMRRQPNIKLTEVYLKSGFANEISFFRTFRKEERRLVLPLRGINADTPPTLRKAMAYIHTHLADDIMLEDAAKASDTSSRTLSRLFSDVDTTFSDFLRYQRVIRSLELMADNTMTIKEIAYDTGFSTPGNFNRSFKQVMGIAPSEMRRRQRA